MRFSEDNEDGCATFFLPVNTDLLPDKVRWYAHHWVPWLLEATLRGLSQVVLVNNPITGIVILIALLLSPGNGPWM